MAVKATCEHSGRAGLGSNIPSAAPWHRKKRIVSFVNRHTSYR